MLHSSPLTQDCYGKMQWFVIPTTCECPLQLPLNYSLQIVFYQNFSDLNTI